MDSKKQQRTIGAIVKVPLEKGGYHTYARILKSPYFAFYDLRTKEEISDLEHFLLRLVPDKNSRRKFQAIFLVA